MKNFIKNMNLARAIILVALVGSLALGWLCWQRQQELEDLKLHLSSHMKPAVEKLMQAAIRNTQLYKASKDENFKAQTDFATYIRKVAAKDKVEVGDVDLAPTNDLRSKGIADEKYRIKPKDKDRTYTRLKIANFLYTLESDSRRVKVTDIKIDTGDKKIKPHEIPEDMWFYEAEVTSRQRTEG